MCCQDTTSLSWIIIWITTNNNVLKVNIMIDGDAQLLS